jgi:putative SOS response-associated peptidase YedK
MCGRFTLTAGQEAIIRRFAASALKGGDDAAPPDAPRYNIAPGQGVLAVREDRDRKEREVVALTWGLVPFWAEDPKIAYKLINARSETAASKPAFRGPMRHKRCLIPASGFYEWKQPGGGRPKQPFFIFPAEAKDRPAEGLMAFAGLWEHWGAPDGSEVESCTILTTEANEALSSLHHRMPVILRETDWARWLDTEAEKPEQVCDLLKPAPEDFLAMYPVAPLVNSPRNDRPELIEKTDAHSLPGEQQELF